MHTTCFSVAVSAVAATPITTLVLCDRRLITSSCSGLVTEDKNKSAEGEKHKPSRRAVGRDPAARGSEARMQEIEMGSAGGCSAETHAGQLGTHTHTHQDSKHPLVTRPPSSCQTAGNLPALFSQSRGGHRASWAWAARRQDWSRIQVGT